uniref:Glycosyltransferase family 1 protein n=2 Tax=Bradyrhizobium amphicarpaeae TaxID=1404768 RepID=A0A2U8PQ86_9BRAD|nr:glycosyltransferase family 1 protein [Bradyrhizobium amphicarpaeae]
MDALRSELDTVSLRGMRVLFGTTRGRGPLWIAPLHLGAFLSRMIGLRLMKRCDLVHVNVASSGSTARKLAVMLVARALGIPYAVHLHGALYEQFYASLSPSRQRLIKRVFRNAARVIVLGEIWRTFAVETLSVLPERVAVLPNAVPTPVRVRVPDPHGVTRLLFLGRLGERKGSRILIQALSRLNDKAGWRAVLAGDGEIEETRRAVARTGIEWRVEVPGWLDPDETATRIAASDVLVLPSFAENLPMSVIEGMAAGLAIVATPVGATPDIVKHGETGLLVPPGDVEALTVALAQLIDDSALRERLSEASVRLHREHLEIGAYARRLISLWRETATCH